MALTPADVAGKLFRLRRRGYDPDEVDGFLDEVESELAGLLLDNDELRRAAGRAGDPMPALAAATGPTTGRAAAGPPVTPEEAEQVALRTLLGAHRAAELLVGEARAAARAQIEQATAHCEELLLEARRRGEQADLEAAQRTEATLGELEDIRRTFDARLDELRRYEAEYRGRLRAHLESQLTTLERLDAEPSRSS